MRCLINLLQQQSAVYSAALLLFLFLRRKHEKIYNTLYLALYLVQVLQLLMQKRNMLLKISVTFLRRGAGEQFKIAGSIQAGEAVNVLDRQGKYTLIRAIKS